MAKRKAPPPPDGGGGSLAIADLSGRDLSSFDGDDEFRAILRQDCSASAADVSAADGSDASEIEALDASRCRLGPEGTARLLSFLSTNIGSDGSPPLPKLRRMCLQRNAMGSAGGRAVGTFLSQNDTVEVMDVSLNDIKAGGGEPTASEVLADALKGNSSLKQLVMEKCALGPEGASHLAGALAANRSLKVLDLGGNMIGPIGGDSLFRALQSNSTLEELLLRMNRIGGGSTKADIQSLSEALTGGSCKLAKLDLSYNDLRCEGASILAVALASKLCPLRELILEKNDIKVCGSVMLSQALSSNDTLGTLVLKGNNVGDDGAFVVGGNLHVNESLRSLDLSSCSIGNAGGRGIGDGLAGNSTLLHLNLANNSLGSGNDASIFSAGVAANASLKEINLSGNSLGVGGDDAEHWGRAIAEAISNNTSLRRVDLSNNSLSDPAIVDAVAGHSSIESFDMSDNDLEAVSIETQLLLSKRLCALELDLSLNPLSSPPLGRLADHSNLQKYLSLLANEKTEVTRIRLMVLGFGGVGKSTFCRAVTNPNEARDFQRTLVPVAEWGAERVADWAERLGTPWAGDAVRLVAEKGVAGKDLPQLVDQSKGESEGSALPSKRLLELCSSKHPSIDHGAFARAISALCAKGYLSTVGAVKVEGTLPLGSRTCSLVDFAGQVEFLTSHQLLLSSMHTLNMVVQPAPSFGKPNHRHYGSWEYWSKFLASLGDRRHGSLLLAVSQLDKLADDEGLDAQKSFIDTEFASIKGRSAGAISCESPLQLDYSPAAIDSTISSVKTALSQSTEQVSRSWWVPLSYETLSEILQRVAQRKSSNHELPILTRSELLEEIDVFCNQSPDSAALMAKMISDQKLLQRAIEYLEAVGDTMQVADEWLLLDPIGWFSSFLSHFIKDDLAVSTIQVDATSLRRQRGTVDLDDIVSALQHEYKSPEEHISQIMSILCGLELCVHVKANERNAATVPVSPSYLFPCLLPPLQLHSELAGCGRSGLDASSACSIRGHRFREASGFLPPGLFVGILARMYDRLQHGVMHSSRMWRDCAVLEFNNKATHVLLRVDPDDAIIDIVGWAPQNEQLFVGAAKGQASIVIWLAHLVKMFLRGYSQLKFEESWLCPNPKCHGIDNGHSIPSAYQGSEFRLSAAPTRQSKIRSHDCAAEGCWRFLGTGHSLEQAALTKDSPSLTCASCNKEPIFALRDRVE